MNTFETLFRRKSTRSFNGKNITCEELNQILKAAYAAPVGHARYETLHLTVISNKDYLNKWEQSVSEATDTPDSHPFYGAPTVILVSSIMSPAPMDNVCFSNAAGIVQNMALAATALGVGSCHIWGAVRVLNAAPALRNELNLPEGMVPCCAIALGHTDTEFTVREVAENRIDTVSIK